MNETDQLLSELDLFAATSSLDGPTSGDPDAISALCEQLANSLLGIGATGPAARWRTLSLVGPSPTQLAPALDHTRQELRALGLSQPSDPEEQDLVTAAHRALAAAEALPHARLVADWARSLMAAGDGAAALALLERQARSSELLPEHCNAVASLLLQLGQAWEAERWLCTSLTQNRRQPQPWFQLARLLLDQGVLDEALEAVQQGLSINSASDWGRNLRARILLTGGSWHSYDSLVAKANALPADPLARLELERLRGLWGRRGLGAGVPQPLPLAQRLELRRLLPMEGLVVLLHGHHADPLCWLLEQGVLSEGMAVQPLASREPLLMAEKLAAAGFRARSEQPAALMKQLAAATGEPVELMVLQRPWNASLPITLGGLLPRVKRLLTPAGLLTPPQFTLLTAWRGWQLHTMGTTTNPG
jgi:tetratricopeptide (TPR) repeat protein